MDALQIVSCTGVICCVSTHATDGLHNKLINTNSRNTIKRPINKDVTNGQICSSERIESVCSLGNIAGLLQKVDCAGSHPEKPRVGEKWQMRGGLNIDASQLRSCSGSCPLFGSSLRSWCALGGRGRVWSDRPAGVLLTPGKGKAVYFVYALSVTTFRHCCLSLHSQADHLKHGRVVG